MAAMTVTWCVSPCSSSSEEDDDDCLGGDGVLALNGEADLDLAGGFSCLNGDDGVLDLSGGSWSCLSGDGIDLVLLGVVPLPTGVEADNLLGGTDLVFAGNGLGSVGVDGDVVWNNGLENASRVSTVSLQEQSSLRLSQREQQSQSSRVSKHLRQWTPQSGLLHC